jgi:hypothetical protein
MSRKHGRRVKWMDNPDVVETSQYGMEMGKRDRFLSTGTVLCFGCSAGLIHS